MKTSINVELKPFMTPNFVRLAVENLDCSVDGSTAVPLSSLDSLTLDRLCDEFRTEVFKKAGQPFPPVAAHRCDCGVMVKE